jgi:hypothetical protein
MPPEGEEGLMIGQYEVASEVRYSYVQLLFVSQLTKPVKDVLAQFRRSESAGNNGRSDCDADTDDFDERVEAELNGCAESDP